MNIQFIVPEIHSLSTGGNIYNRQIISRLAKREEVKVIISRGELLHSVSSKWTIRVTPPSVVVLDSLLMADTKGIRLLRKKLEHHTFILLLHYLHCLNPLYESSTVADRERKLLQLFDGIIATSQYARNRLLSLGVSADIICVVKPGLEEFYHRPIARRPQSDHVNLLTVANLLPGKGLCEFIPVLESLQDLSWEWHLAGADSLDPDYSARFCQQLNRSPIQTWVRLLGPVSEEHIINTYDACDLFVLPSLFDNSPLAVREAMSRGLPVVSYDVGGIGEIVTESRSGYLLPVGDWDCLASVLREMISDNKRRTVAGQYAHLTSRAFSSWDDVMRNFYQFLEESVVRTSQRVENSATLSLHS